MPETKTSKGNRSFATEQELEQFPQTEAENINMSEDVVEQTGNKKKSKWQSIKKLFFSKK